MSSFSVVSMFSHSLSCGMEINFIFVDLRKAYDTIPIVKLWNAMRAAGINEIYVKAAKNFYENNVL